MALPGAVTVVTQNLWFDAYERPARMAGHLRQWQELNADVIAVQEATLACLRPLLESEWLQAGYHSTVSLESEANWQGVAVFSRYPPDKVTMTPLPGSMGRRLLQVEWPGLHLGVVHLESTGAAGAVRAEQLRTAFQHLSARPDALLVGDFNFCSTSTEQAQLPAEYLDLWGSLCPGEPGWTQDTAVNTMMLRQFRKEKAARYDRMLLRSATWKARSCQRVGLSGLGEGLFASDHFGLVAELAR